MKTESPETFRIRPESPRIEDMFIRAYRSREILKMGETSFAVIAGDGTTFVLQEVVLANIGKIDGLPPLESTVRIAPGDLKIWPDAEQFIGADCTLKAVFMTGEQRMVAVEHQEDLVCCCFRAEMVRTPEQAKAEEREKAVDFMMEMTSSLGHSDVSKRILFTELYDKGLRFTVKP